MSLNLFFNYYYYCNKMNIIDQYCTLDGQVIWTCTLNQTNIKSNNNKFYIMQLIQESSSKHYYIFTRYGRVGYEGNNSLKECINQESAESFFKRQFKNKTGNVWDPINNNKNFKRISGKYYLCIIEDPKMTIKENIKKIDKKPINIKPEVLDLIKLLSNKKQLNQTIRTLNIDTKRMPLGKISKSQLDTARDILNDIDKNLVNYNKDKLEDLSSYFYTLIPYSCGMSVPPIINNKKFIGELMNLLQDLSQIQITGQIIKNINGDSNDELAEIYNKLDCKIVAMDPIKHKKHWDLLETYVKRTHCPTHNFNPKILNIYQIQHSKQNNRYYSYLESNPELKKNKMLLFHGSKLGNWLGILNKSLLLFPSNVMITGKMFGNGLYFASQSSKSMNYMGCHRSQPIGFLMLCEVALGNQFKCNNSHYITDYNHLPKDTHSTWGMGKTTTDSNQYVRNKNGVVIPCGKLIDSNISGSLLYDEFIVYKEEQIRPAFLIKIKMF